MYHGVDEWTFVTGERNHRDADAFVTSQVSHLQTSRQLKREKGAFLLFLWWLLCALQLEWIVTVCGDVCVHGSGPNGKGHIA